MSPLGIILLLKLYACANPREDYPIEQRMAPAMKEAFALFQELGFLADGVSHASVMGDDNPYLERLSDKGLAMVERLCSAELEAAQQPAAVPAEQVQSEWTADDQREQDYFDRHLDVTPTQPPAGELPVLLPGQLNGDTPWLNVQPDAFCYVLKSETVFNGDEILRTWNAMRNALLATRQPPQLTSDYQVGYTAGHYKGYCMGIEKAAKVCANADKSAHPSDLADAIRALNKTGAA